MKHKLLTLLLTSSMAIAAFAAPAPSILSIKETIKDDAIVYPESFETDTQEMMKNWYIQNYTVLDESVEYKPNNDVSDAEYVRRLRSMPTIIEMPFNQVVKSYIQMYTQKKRTLVEAMLGMSLYYMPIFEQSLEKEGLPLELKYLPVIESALNPNAVSRAGATGLWQFMMGTAKGLGLEVNSLVDERRDPYRSSDKAAKYLKSLYNIYGDWSLAIAAYNCGPGNVNKAIRRAAGVQKDFWAIYPFLPAETRGYVPAFIAANYVMTYFKKHNISPTLAKKPLITDTVHVTKRIHLKQISEVLAIPLEEIQVLNPHFRQDIIPGDIRPYSLSLPSQQVYSFIMSEDSIVTHNAALYARRDIVEPASYSQASSNSDSETKLVVKYHKVRKGETLSVIARKYGVSASNIKKWNHLRKNSVKRGQSLRINTYKTVTRDTEEEPEQETTEVESSQEETQEETVAQAPREKKTSKEKAEPKEDSPKSKKESATSKKKKSEVQENEDTSSTEKKSKKESAKSSKKSKNDVTEEETVSKKKKSSKKDTAEEETTSKSKKKKSKKETTKTHKIRKGENLSTIADKYGVSVSELKKANKISGTKITAGDKIKIPAK